MWKWKLFTGVLSNELYDHLERERILPDEQKKKKKDADENQEGRKTSC